MSDIDILEREEGAGAQEELDTSSNQPVAEADELESLNNSSQSDNLYKPGKEKTSFGQKARSAFSGKKRRRRLIAGTLLGGSSIMLIFLLVFLVSSMTIPNFMEHVTAYQFARTAREFAKTSEQIQGEKIMLDTAADGAGSAEQGFFRGMSDRYQGTRNGVWDKINSYRPEKVVDNLETTGRLTYQYEDGVSIGGFTRQRLTGITLDGVEISASNPTFSGKLLNPIQNFKDRINFKSDLSTGLESSLEGRMTLFRSRVAKNIRGRTDSVQVRWVRNKSPPDNNPENAANKDPKNAANYEGDTRVADRLNAQESAVVATDNGKSLSAASSEELLSSNKDAEKAAVDAQIKCLEDAKCIDETIASGKSTPKPVLEALDNALKSDTLNQVTSTISTVAAVAIPLCLIYDGSIVNSKNTIDAQTDSNIRAFTSEAAISDQQKAGQNVTAGAIGANVRALHGTDGIGTSVPELRANNLPVDTSSFGSTQASASQSFTLLDAIPGIPDIAVRFMNSAAETVCPLVTNTYAMIGLGVGEIILGTLSGGSINLADAGLKEFVTLSVKDFLANFSTKDFVKGLVVQGALIGGATLLAKVIVGSRAASIHNGLARGNSLTAEVDAGGNAMASYVDQKMFYGAPMKNMDVAISALNDQEYLARQQSKLPFTQRYFAIGNPNSLLTKFGTTIASFVNISSSKRIINSLFHLINPFTSFASIFNHWGKGSALAASEVDNTNYGQVQFGWTPDEEAKIESDASYQHPLENQYILDASGKEDEIKNKYKDCFEETIGQLLSETKIQRNDKGNVIDNKGLCSPQNLSYNNHEGYGDLVFRWRLAMRQSNTLDHLINIQSLQVAP